MTNGDRNLCRAPVLGSAIAIMLVVAFSGSRALSAEVAAPAETPSAVVEDLDDTLLEAMRNADDLGYEGRYELLAPRLEATFDYPFMARVSVGGHWRDLDPDQQSAFVDRFGRLSAATFADRFDGYSGERFEVTGEEERPRGTVLVRNDLIKADGSKVPIDFLLRERDGAWRVVDIYLDGTYSELAIKRSEYTSVIERDGFDALMTALDDQIISRASQANP